MAIDLKVWLPQHSPSLCAAVIQRAPNMLPEEKDIAVFVELLAQQAEAPRHEQLQAVQAWALSAIARESYSAGDWLTILRVLKEEIIAGLREAFPAEETLDCWSGFDRLFTYATVEAAQLTSQVGQADLIEHTVELREELERLENIKSSFITVGAHELRTPLTIVEGYANMLKSEMDPASHMGLYLNGLENGMLRLREIIGDMIDMSLMDLQSFELNYQQVNLEKMVGLVVQNLSRHFMKREVDLVIESFTHPLMTYADPQRLVKALEKVLLNGLKYTPDGGRVTIFIRPARQDEVDDEINGFAEIEVRDTGIGIDPLNLENIFDKFSSVNDVRFHSSSKTAFKGGGAGLGLPISRGIVEAHGGRIWADSDGFDESALLGSKFIIELPLYRNAPVSVEGDA